MRRIAQAKAIPVAFGFLFFYGGLRSLLHFEVAAEPLVQAGLASYWALQSVTFVSLAQIIAGTALVFGNRKRPWLLGSLGLPLAWCVPFILSTLHRSPPDCGCGAMLVPASSPMARTAWGVCRNLLLMLFVGIHLKTTPAHASSSSSTFRSIHTA